MTKVLNKYIAIFLVLLFLPLTGNAQEKLDCSVVSFAVDPFSTAAQDKRYEMIDGNGDRYAIIKVKDVDGEADLSGLTFNFGTLNSVVKSHDDGLWVYVQRNAKTVTIKHPEYKTIEKYDLNTTIKPGKTYIMQLTLSRVQKTIVRNVKKQVLQFKISPANEKAVVKVKKAGDKGEYELWGEVDEAGTIDKMLDFGSYDYIVTALNYESSAGRVTLSNSQTTYVEQLILKPNFGYLEIDGNNGATGAQIYVDDVKIGTVPYLEPDTRWKCGSHKITINNGDLYKPYNSTFVIKQGETTKISPKLESDFAQTTIRTDVDAEIFIDEQSMGIGTWTGPLKVGQYVVVCRKLRHNDSGMTITVKPDQADTFVIPSPTPITGNIYVRSTPSGATIDIDGEVKGVTPALLQGIIIGEHTITLSLENHKAEQHGITVNKNETHDINAQLSDIANITIYSTPNKAELTINGKSVGYTPYTAEMSSGDYDIVLKKARYKTYKGNVHLDSSSPQKMIALTRQYQRPYSFYIQPTVQVGSSMAVGGAIGGYIANVNIEGYYQKVLNNETVYWNSTAVIPLRPIEENFKFSSFGARLGYGIICGSRLRITPLIDLGITSIDGNKKTKCNVLKSSFGCKIDFVLLNHISVNVTPEYGFPVKKSDIYKLIEPTSTKIKSLSNGFGCTLGLCCSF